MTSATAPPLSTLVRAHIDRPSPIRQIMKMAERQNILAMGLDPATVTSFGGGWVNHAAPDAFRQAYADIAADADLFHKSGGYTATLGELSQLPRRQCDLGCLVGAQSLERGAQPLEDGKRGSNPTQGVVRLSQIHEGVRQRELDLQP